MNTLAVIGLGYVGLPLVVEFGKQLRTIGFDIAQNKVDACLRGTDPSRELPDSEMADFRRGVKSTAGFFRYVTLTDDASILDPPCG